MNTALHPERPLSPPDRGDADPGAEDRAIQSIVDEFLLVGDCYPRAGGRICVDAGAIVRDALDEDEVDAILSSVLSGNADAADRSRRKCERAVRENAPAFLRRYVPMLIEQRAEELAEDAS